MQRTTKIWLLILAFLVLGAGAYAIEHYQTTAPPILSADNTASLENVVGTRVTIVGKAVDAQAGAILRTDSQVIYINNLASWPAELRDAKIAATGVLVSKKYIPDPGTPELPASGTQGNQFVLEEATFEFVP